MKKRTSLLVLAVIMTASAGSAVMAADLAPPPPPAPEIRPSVADWTGPYIGVQGGVTCMESRMMHYNTVEDGTTVNDDDDFDDPGESWDGSSTTNQVRGPYDLNGCGFAGGVMAGYNYQIDSVIFGVEGDWNWGGRTGDHLDVYEKDRYDMDWMASVRLRAGILATDQTLFYLTGGPSWMRGELIDVNTNTGFKETHFGWTIGGGIEHALTENIHIRGEYLFAKYGNKKYGPFCTGCATDGNPNTATVEPELKKNEFHTFRLGVSWNFPISNW